MMSIISNVLRNHILISCPRRLQFFLLPIEMAQTRVTRTMTTIPAAATIGLPENHIDDNGAATMGSMMVRAFVLVRLKNWSRVGWRATVAKGCGHLRFNTSTAPAHCSHNHFARHLASCFGGFIIIIWRRQCCGMILRGRGGGGGGYLLLMPKGIFDLSNLLHCPPLSFFSFTESNFAFWLSWRR